MEVPGELKRLLVASDPRLDHRVQLSRLAGISVAFGRAGITRKLRESDLAITVKRLVNTVPTTEVLNGANDHRDGESIRHGDVGIMIETMVPDMSSSSVRSTSEQVRTQIPMRSVGRVRQLVIVIAAVMAAAGMMVA